MGLFGHQGREGISRPRGRSRQQSHPDQTGKTQRAKTHPHSVDKLAARKEEIFETTLVILAGRFDHRNALWCAFYPTRRLSGCFGDITLLVIRNGSRKLKRGKEFGRDKGVLHVPFWTGWSPV